MAHTAKHLQRRSQAAFASVQTQLAQATLGSVQPQLPCTRHPHDRVASYVARESLPEHSHRVRSTVDKRVSRPARLPHDLEVQTTWPHRMLRPTDNSSRRRAHTPATTYRHQEPAFEFPQPWSAAARSTPRNADSLVLCVSGPLHIQSSAPLTLCQ